MNNLSLQKIKALYLLTTSNGINKGRISSILLKMLWSRYWQPKAEAISFGWLRVSSFSLVDHECQTWKWTSEAVQKLSSVEITRKPLLKILEKRISRSRIHSEIISYGIRNHKRREGHYVGPFFESGIDPLVLSYHAEFMGETSFSFRNRIYTDLVNSKKNERASELRKRFGEDFEKFDARSAWLCFSIYDWKHENDAKLRAETRKILRSPSEFRADFMKTFNLSQDNAKKAISTFLTSGKRRYHIPSSRQFASFLDMKYPALADKFKECTRGKVNFHKKALEFETKLFRGKDGIEKRFLNKMGKYARFFDCHDGVFVAKSQAKEMMSCIMSACSFFDYSVKLIDCPALSASKPSIAAPISLSETLLVQSATYIHIESARLLNKKDLLYEFVGS